MNKKIKNIASVVQTKSAAVLCTLCAVLFLASCAEDEMADGTHSQKQDLRTVSVNFDMPADKPSFGDGTASRAALDAQPAEILLGDSTLTVSRTSSDTYYTTSNWVDGDWLLVKIDAGSTQGRLTLEYHDSEERPTRGWHLLKSCSYFKYKGDTYYGYNDDELPQGVLPILEITESEENAVLIDTSNPLTIHLDWTATAPTVSLIYINPESMTWDDTGKLSYYWGATEAPELWIADGTAWTTPQARLRVYTGAEGDVVTLTSSAFDTASDDEPGTYEATTDAEGYAYFYGATGGQLTDDFLVELTQMCVPVQTPSGSQTGGETESVSEGRSIILDNYSKEFFTITLDTPITLLEASDVVPVTLAATKAYRIEANVKRTASAKENLSVIDGKCGITVDQDGFYLGTADHVAAVKKQIETAVAMGITDFIVVNELALYDQFNFNSPSCASTVVGEAVRQFGAVNNDTKITLTLNDAIEVLLWGFYQCTALQSVSAPAATEIGVYAFNGCTALQSVSASVATEIGEYAFYNCSSLQLVTLGEVTNIGAEAFSNTRVTNLNFDYVTSLGSNALSGLTYANLEMGKEAAVGATITLAKNAFTGCRLTGSVTFHRVVSNSTNDGLTNRNAFYEVATSELDLFLHAEQPIDQISVSNDGKLMWAGAEWASITLLDGPNGTAGTKYYIDNGMPTVEIDGTCGITGNNPIGEETHVSAMEQKIKVVAVAATANAPAKVIVKKGLASFGGLPKTVVGNAINRGYVHLVLDDAITSIPKEAFENNGVLVSVTTSATTIGESAFYGCSSLTSVSLRATSATTIGEIAFMACSHLATVDLSANTAIGESTFEDCFELTGMDWTKVTSIGVEAFLSCSSLTGELSLPNVTSIGDDSFQGCTFTKVTFGKVVTGYESAFEFANVSNCDLELAAGQTGVTASGGKLMWAGAEWKSITVGGVQYKAVGNELYAVIDGSVTDVDAMMAQIQAVPANTKILVTNGLAAYTKENPTPTDIYAGTVVGEAIRLLTSQAMPTNTSEEDYIGSISLVLDDGITEIPDKAFMYCKELGSVVANGVTTIGIGAFYECTGIKELTFGKVITEVGNDAFGLAPRDNYYCWSNKCVLTLKSGQLLLTFDSSSYKYTSQGSEQQVQAGTDIRWCGTAWQEIKLVSNTQ